MKKILALTPLTPLALKYGAGFIRIKNELKNYPNNSYEFRDIAGGMQIIFYKNLHNVTDNRSVMILEILKKNSTITITELAFKFDVNVRTILRDMEKLKNSGVVKRIGTAKSGYWKINKK